MIKEIKNAIENKKLFDWIANNYWRLTKEELKRLCLELEYVRDSEVRGIGNSDEALIEALEDSFEFSDDEL